MATIHNFIVCESHQSNFSPNGLVLTLTAPLLVLTPQQFPTNYSFSLSVGVLDYSESGFLRVLFKKDSTLLHDTGPLPFPMGMNHGSLPQNLWGVTLGIDLRNVLLPESGEYQAEVYIDESLKGQYSIIAHTSEEAPI